MHNYNYYYYYATMQQMCLLWAENYKQGSKTELRRMSGLTEFIWQVSSKTGILTSPPAF